MIYQRLFYNLSPDKPIHKYTIFKVFHLHYIVMTCLIYNLLSEMTSQIMYSNSIQCLDLLNECEIIITKVQQAKYFEYINLDIILNQQASSC